MQVQQSPQPALAQIAPEVEIGLGVELGRNVVIHEGTRIDRGAVIQDGAVVGKSPHLGTLRPPAARRLSPP